LAKPQGMSFSLDSEYKATQGIPFAEVVLDSTNWSRRKDMFAEFAHVGHEVAGTFHEIGPFGPDIACVVDQRGGPQMTVESVVDIPGRCRGVPEVAMESARMMQGQA